MAMKGDRVVGAARPDSTDGTVDGAGAVQRPGMLRLHGILVGVTTLGVFVQAVLAGRGQFIDHTFIDIHGYVANAIFLLVIAQAAVALLAGVRGRFRLLLLGLNLLLLVLVFAQVGLGYAGRTSHTAASLHLPLGVLLFGLLVTAMALVSRIRRESGG
jgi:hypothetical protein